jgi:hypothetical protein
VNFLKARSHKFPEAVGGDCAWAGVGVRRVRHDVGQRHPQPLLRRQRVREFDDGAVHADLKNKNFESSAGRTDVDGDVRDADAVVVLKDKRTRVGWLEHLRGESKGGGGATPTDGVMKVVYFSNLGTGQCGTRLPCE